MGGKKDKIRTRWQTLGNYLFEWKLQSGVKFRNKNSIKNILVFHSATASTFITQNKVFVQALYIWCRLTSWRRHFADLDNRQELQKDSFQFFSQFSQFLDNRPELEKRFLSVFLNFLSLGWITISLNSLFCGVDPVGFIHSCFISSFKKCAADSFYWYFWYW